MYSKQKDIIIVYWILPLTDWSRITDTLYVANAFVSLTWMVDPEQNRARTKDDVCNRLVFRVCVNHAASTHAQQQDQRLRKSHHCRRTEKSCPTHLKSIYTKRCNYRHAIQLQQLMNRSTRAKSSCTIVFNSKISENCWQFYYINYFKTFLKINVDQLTTKIRFFDDGLDTVHWHCSGFKLREWLNKKVVHEMKILVTLKLTLLLVSPPDLRFNIYADVDLWLSIAPTTHNSIGKSEMILKRWNKRKHKSLKMLISIF